MGLATSKTQKDAQCKLEGEERSTGGSSNVSFNMERESMKVETSRVVELMQAIQRIARLQRECTSARIDARQKRREALLKRQDVWIWDDKLMRELQHLKAEGKLVGLKELLRIAEQCEILRGGLGPLEQEGMEAEQRWEGTVWNLRQAEEQLYTEFAYEFEAAESYPQAPTSPVSSEYTTSSSAEGHIVSAQSGKPMSGSPSQERVSTISPSSFPQNQIQRPPLYEALNEMEERPQIYETSTGLNEMARQDSELLGMDSIDGPDVERFGVYSDSGFGDIDESLGQFDSEDSTNPRHLVPESLATPIELYPDLVTDFASRRERINNWLENMVLISRVEGTTLFTIIHDLLQKEDIQMPSNWSQLVIAYWELDGAALPRNRRRTHRLAIPRTPPEKIEQESPETDLQT